MATNQISPEPQSVKPDQERDGNFTTSPQFDSGRDGLKHFGLEPVGTHLHINFSAEVTGYGEIGGRLFYQLSTEDATYDIFPEQTSRTAIPASEDESEKPPMPAHDYALQWALDTASGKAGGGRFEWGDRNLARCYRERNRELEEARDEIAARDALLRQMAQALRQASLCVDLPIVQSALAAYDTVVGK